MVLLRAPRLALALLAGGAYLTLAAPAEAESVDYSATYDTARPQQSVVPALLSKSDRDYYSAVFRAIDKEDWKQVQDLLAQRSDGPLQKVALAEYYLAAHSPKVELPQIEDWLKGGANLPQAPQLVRLGLKRGLTDAPALPVQQSFSRQSSPAKRVRPASIDDGTMLGRSQTRDP